MHPNTCTHVSRVTIDKATLFAQGEHHGKQYMITFQGRLVHCADCLEIWTDERTDQDLQRVLKRLFAPLSKIPDANGMQAQLRQRKAAEGLIELEDRE